MVHRCCGDEGKKMERRVRSSTVSRGRRGGGREKWSAEAMLLACSGSVLVRLSRTPERDFSSRWRLPKSNGGGSSDDGESDNTVILRGRMWETSDRQRHQTFTLAKHALAKSSLDVVQVSAFYCS